MIISVHQPQYLPWLGFFDKIAKSDCFVFLDEVQYKSREFQNRNKIRTKDGWIWLSVPVITKGKGRQRISQVLIDNEFPWARQHLASLKTWYAKAKFFKGYLPFFEETYARKWEKLIDLNIHIINFLLKQLSITTPIYFESKLRISSIKTERIIEICKKIEADTYLSGIGGKEYLEEDKFSLANIKLVYQDFSHPEYGQLFKPFIPFMSVVDLLFNHGEDSLKILQWNNFL
ncbi:MAG: WbqC family protein [Candidatus Omnitrophota bacterium]